MDNALLRIALAALVATVVAIMPAQAQSGGRWAAVEVSEAVSAVAEDAIPAVVLVEVDRGRRLSLELHEVLQEIGAVDAWPSGGEREAKGSGVIVSADGRVITNYHVIDGAMGITVELSDQRRLPARVVSADPRTDLAVLQIDGGGPLPFAELGDSDAVRVGDLVVAVGNPFEFQSTVTFGIVSAVGRRGLAEGEIQDYLQTDAAVNPGSSGGPLLDLSGRVIGINTAIFAPKVDQNAGISFAIPSNMVKRVVEELERGGRVPRAWLGLMSRSVEEVDGDATLRGAEVLRVVPDSPAEHASLRRGDIIIEVNGEPIPSRDDLRTLILAGDVGASLEIVVSRDGQRVVLHAVTGEERAYGAGLEDLPEDARYWAGAFLAEPRDELRALFGVGRERGLLVVRVEPGSDAARLGLKTGDLLLEVAGDPVTGLQALDALIRDKTTGVVFVGIERGGEPAYAILPAPQR